MEDLTNLQDALVAAQFHDPMLKNDTIHSLIQDIRSLMAVMDATGQRAVYPIMRGNMVCITGRDPDKL